MYQFLFLVSEKNVVNNIFVMWRNEMKHYFYTPQFFCSTNFKFGRYVYLCYIHKEIRYWSNIQNILYLKPYLFLCIHISTLYFICIRNYKFCMNGTYVICICTYNFVSHVSVCFTFGCSMFCVYYCLSHLWKTSDMFRDFPILHTHVSVYCAWKHE